MIYLIEKFCGHEAAFIAEKVFMVNTYNQSQKTFSIFQPQHRHTDDDIITTQQYIEHNYSKRLRVEDLALRCNMSGVIFIRRFELATGNSPLEYLQRVRIEAAKRLLEEGRKNVKQKAVCIIYDDLSFSAKYSGGMLGAHRAIIRSGTRASRPGRWAGGVRRCSLRGAIRYPKFSLYYLAHLHL